MKYLPVLLCAFAIFDLRVTNAASANGETPDRFSTDILDPPRFEIGAQSGYLLGIFGNPNSYEIVPNFLAARIRWGVIQNDNFWHGYNQFCLTGLAEPIVRGIENHYFGLNFGDRYNFVRQRSRFTPFFFGGLGLGWIDSNPDMRGSQGQDFTFNILMAIGCSYQIDPHWKIDAQLLYQHLSNGGQTDPNPSLNLLGPQVGISYSF